MSVVATVPAERTLDDMTTNSGSEATEAATALRAVLGAVDAGDLEADQEELDYLHGAVDTLDAVSQLAA